MRPIHFALLLVTSIVGCQTPRLAVSERALLQEANNLDQLSRFPDPAFSCRQFSSYDRASTSPDNQETWFANGDVNQYIRTETNGGRKEYVMMDADGPGAIVRVWSANPAGTIRIYLDEQAAPVIEMKMDEFLGGKALGFPAPLAGEVSKGWNNYFPICYAKHCKVTSDQPGFYYHVDYRTYDKTTATETLTAAGLTRTTQPAYRLAGLLGYESVRDAKGRMSAPVAARAVPPEFGAPSGGRQADARWHVLRLGANSKGTVVDLQGAREISGLAVQVAADDLQQALRHLVLWGEFDGEHTIEAPLGDFFGSAPGATPYTSLPMGISDSGVLWSRWRMPFQHRGRLIIANRGSQPVSISFRVLDEGRAWTNDSMYFHANWKSEHGFATRPMRDWNYVTVKGKGVFVGAAFAIANPVRQWWGEGDEKIYVDGEKFPSFFGTGTEDYYGYAWCWPVPFNHPFHNETRCDGPGNYGHTAVNRWHILDKIPFQHDFRFDMEIWHWSETARPDFSVVAYWYGAPGAKPDNHPIADDELVLNLLPAYVSPRVAGAIEAESLRVIEKNATVEPQDLEGCSGEQQLWWHGPAVGDKLVLELPPQPAGRYQVYLRCVKAPDYGIHRFSINGTALGGPVDLFNHEIKASDELNLGVAELGADAAKFSVECTGANAKARKGNMCGLDYIRLDRIP